MKIRTDFVTNSSSSSYCTITIDDGSRDAFGRSPSFDLTCWGFYTFWFHDPEKMLAECKNVDDLKKAIVYSLGGNDVNEEFLEEKLSEIADFDKIERIEIDCHEEIADRDWDDPWPRDVWYTYDFKTGLKTAGSDCPWQQYKGYGDPLRPDVRDAEGRLLEFTVEERKGMQCVFFGETDKKEISIPEEVFVSGQKVVVEGLGQGCFDEAWKLKTLTLPKSIEYIAPGAFDGCRDSLKRIQVEGASGDEPFVNRDDAKLNLMISKESKYVIPEDIAELGDSAFGGCWKLKTIVLHDGMKKPTKAALSSTPTLEEVVLSDGSKVRVVAEGSRKCFTVSKGVIGFNYKKCAELMADAESAEDFKWAVEAGGLAGEALDGLYAKIKRKRKPAFKEMKAFLIEKGAKK